jgi:hypothetical protein
LDRLCEVDCRARLARGLDDGDALQSMFARTAGYRVVADADGEIGEFCRIGQRSFP